MRDQFVTYEIAVKLKEKGFQEKCFGYYMPDNYKEDLTIYTVASVQGSIDSMSVHSNLNDGSVSAPLWQQAIEWLECAHGIYVSAQFQRLRPIKLFEYHINMYDADDKYGFTYLSGEHDFETKKEAIKSGMEKALDLIFNPSPLKGDKQ